MAEEKDFIKIAQQVRQVYDAVTATFKELIEYKDVVSKDDLKAIREAMRQAKAKVLAYQAKAKVQIKLKKRQLKLEDSVEEELTDLAPTSVGQEPEKLLMEDKAVKLHGPEFIAKVKEICARVGLNPNFLMATMAAECNFKHTAVNPMSGATGLIQFMPSTAKGLGTTTEALAKMTALQQLDYVEKYLKTYGKKIQQLKEPAESYFLIFYPYAIGKPDSYILGSQKSDAYARKIAEQNKIYDLNKDGYITKGEVLEYQRKHKYKDIYDGTTLNTDVKDDVIGSSISDSVGKGGTNKLEDVKVVQTLLNGKGHKLVVDGICGKGTIGAIEAFQKEVMNGFSDGLISAGGRTWGFLSKGGSDETTEEETEDQETPPTGGQPQSGKIPAGFVRMQNSEVTPELSKAAVHYLNVFTKKYPPGARDGHYGEFIRFNTEDGKEFLAHFEVHEAYGADPSKPHKPHPSIGLFKNTANDSVDEGSTDTEDPKDEPIGSSISADVGAGGTNDLADVKVVQTLLNKHGHGLVVDGLCGKGTIGAIEAFQKANMNGFSDGLISVGGRTWGLLNGGSSDSSETSDDTTTTDETSTDEPTHNESETWDHHTNKRIKTLDARVQGAALKFVNQVESQLGLTIRVTSAFRSLAEQDALFNKGGVTQARGGQSYHNYGLAIDIVEIADGKAIWSNPNWGKIAAIGKGLGFEWGGDWTSFVDKPHFQMTFGKSVKQLMAAKYPDRYKVIYGTDAPTVEEDDDAPIGTTISASVGKGGTNNKADVKVVQTLLNDKGASLSVDGGCGPKTIGAIEAFQKKEMNGFSDGLISVGGRTWKLLSGGSTKEDDKEEDTSSESSEETTTTPVEDVKIPSNISAAVGKGGANKPEDVKVVQFLLVKNKHEVPVDGICSPETIAAIEKFQSELGLSKPDGRVDPGGRSWRGLTGKEGKGGLPAGPANKPNWIKIAEGEIGVKENTSKTEHNPRVIEYHSTTGGFKNDETPWCSSFVNWVMKKAGKGGTNSAMAVSWKNYGKDLGKPAYGSIAVIDWDGPGPGWKGHVGFVVGKKGGNVLILGGNQANAVNVKSFGTSKIVAYVVPSDYEVPANAYTFGESEGDFGDMDLGSTR